MALRDLEEIREYISEESFSSDVAENVVNISTVSYIAEEIISAYCLADSRKPGHGPVLLCKKSSSEIKEFLGEVFAVIINLVKTASRD